MWRAATSLVFFVCFGACMCWSIVAVISGGHVVAAVACMCACLVSSFGMLMCFLTRPVARPAVRRIEIVGRKNGLGVVACSETAVVCVAVECKSRRHSSSPGSSPGSPGVMLCVFDPA